MRRSIQRLSLLLVLAPPCAFASGKGQDSAAEARHEASWAEVSQVAPPAGLPLVGPDGADADGYPRRHVDRPALRSLLLNRRFAALTRALETFQGDFEARPRRELWIHEAVDTLGFPHPNEGALIDEWAAASPKSFAPYLIRAGYSVARGFLLRGSRRMSDTSELERSSMAEAFERARRDLVRALSLRSGLVEATRLLVKVEIAGGSRDLATRAIEDALRRCPECYEIRVEWVAWALLPKWGGSYEEMEAFAARASPANPRHRRLRGFVDLDRAEEAARERRTSDALVAMEGACALGDDWRFLKERASLRREAGDMAGRLADLERADAAEPGVPSVVAARAWALAEARRWEEAARDTLYALRSDPTSVVGLWLQPRVVRALDVLAWQAHQEGKGGDARRLYELARALAPKDERIAGRAQEVAKAHPSAAAAAGPAPASGDANPELKLLIVDAAGRPVPGARVVLWPGAGNWEQLQLMASAPSEDRADANGRFAKRLPPGPWVAMAVLPTEPLVGVAAPVAVATPGVEARLVIDGARRIEGRVVDTANRPAPDVEVRAIPDGDRIGPVPRSLAAARTRDDGTFTLPSVDEGRYVLFAHGAGLSGPAERPTLGRPTIAGEADVVIRVQRDRVLRGRVLVRSADGGVTPADHFTISGPFRQREVASPDGRFTLELEPRASTVRIAFSVEGRPPLLRIFEPLDGENEVGDLVVGPGRTLRGRVLDPRGEPVSGARVVGEWGSPIAWTGTDGGFEGRVPDGAFGLEVEHPRWIRHAGKVDADQQQVEVRLSAGGRIRVLAVDASGAPVRGARLTAISGTVRPRGCQTDETGRCEIAGLDAADYFVEARGAEGLDPNAPLPPKTHLDVAQDEVRALRIAWPREATRLVVKVLDQKGVPSPRVAMLFPGAPSVTDALQPNGRPRLPYALAGAQGIENLPPGRYTAIALGLWGMPACATETIDFAGGRDREVTLRLRDDSCR